MFSISANAPNVRVAQEDIMIIRNALLYLGVAASLGSFPAASVAQLPTGRSGFSTSRSVGAREYWDALRYFGRCFAISHRSAAFDLLATQPGSAEEGVIFTRLFAGRDIDCLGNMSRMSVVVPLVRGSIAEGLLGLGTPVPPQLIVAAPAPGAPIRTLTEVARCYAAAHRAETRALIAGTRPGSEEEVTALGHMESDLFRCVPPAASNYQFQSTDLRYHLAEALLRLPAEAAPARP
jgi:hypothetical protein